VWHLTGTLLTLLVDVAHFLRLCWRPSAVLAAENLFLRKQLACYQERQVKPRRATDAARLALVWLGPWFDWRQALTIVQPATFIRWHRQGFRLGSVAKLAFGGKIRKSALGKSTTCESQLSCFR
jgi:putative transposase